MAKKYLKKNKKAIFISVEGLEGCGKSSVVRFLKKILQEKKMKASFYQEPGSTKIGKKLRKILLDKKNREISPHTELLLYLAARTQLIEEKLAKDISRLDAVVCDRFYDSTLAYQAYALGLGETARKAVSMFKLGVVPDLTLFLDVKPQAGLNRLKNKDRIESRSLFFHKKLRRGFLELAKRQPKRIKVIDASGSLSQVYSRVRQVLSKEKII